MISISYANIAATTLVVMAGWWVVHLLTSFRERDRFRREILAQSITSTIEIINNTFESIIDYHTKDRDFILERRILISMDRISFRIQNFPLYGIKETVKKEIVDKFLALKISSTDKHFSEEHDFQMDANNELILAVHHATMELENSILELNKYCHQPLHFIVINYWCDLKEGPGDISSN